MKKFKPSSRLSIEQEVITAVVTLYMMIALVMIIVHYIQPHDQKTASSSVSPSHTDSKRVMP